MSWCPTGCGNSSARIHIRASGHSGRELRFYKGLTGFLRDSAPAAAARSLDAYAASRLDVGIGLPRKFFVALSFD